MKEIIDNFSNQSAFYKKYRPSYPKELYDEILKFCHGRENCWDCGTGNGQAAVELAKHFKFVFATDISNNQIKHAELRSNINYSVERAEKTSFDNDQFDLITVGQAIHWFDFGAFNLEASRVSKNNGIIAIWGYDIIRISEEIRTIIDDFYLNIVGPYWNKERKHIDNKYETVNFNFKELEAPKHLSIDVNWSFKNLIGYLSSWSSVANYKKANDNEDPLRLIIEKLERAWGEKEIRRGNFPIFMRIGQVIK